MLCSKNRWNRDEFIHAALIMVNYHRLASIMESFRFDIGENKQNIELEKLNLVNYDSEEKTKLFNNIQSMNEEEKEMDKPKKRKFSEDDKFNNSFNHDSDSAEDFQKHLSNFCTIYLDFDSHSDKLHSALVKFLITLGV